MADWQMLNAKREHLVNENLRRANLKRRRHDYAVNHKVLKKLHAPTKWVECTRDHTTLNKFMLMATLQYNCALVLQKGSISDV